MKLSGADILIQSLADYRVDTIFGYPGACVISILDRIYGNRQIRRVLVRHEQGAVHAACGYAQLANKPGIVLVTSGPGATNTVTGIADAFSGGVPLVVITGQVSSGLLGTDAFQEADMISMTAPVTKWNCQIRRAGEIAGAVSKAFHVATSGRPGPVLLDITKDAQTETFRYVARVSTGSPPSVHYSETVAALSPLPACEKVLRALEESGRETVLAIDRVPNDFYSGTHFCSGRVLKSGVPGVAGFGLPAAIGAACAVSDKTICLVAGTSEFQATIEELGVIRQEGLAIKIVLLHTPPGGRFRITNPDFMRIADAYGIQAQRVDPEGDLCGGIHTMLHTAGSYLLEIGGGTT